MANALKPGKPAIASPVHTGRARGRQISGTNFKSVPPPEQTSDSDAETTATLVGPPAALVEREEIPDDDATIKDVNLSDYYDSERTLVYQRSTAAQETNLVALYEQIQTPAAPVPAPVVELSESRFVDTISATRSGRMSLGRLAVAIALLSTIGALLGVALSLMLE